MDQQDTGPAARSCGKECEPQGVGQVVSNWQVAEMGVHHTLLFRELSDWMPGMLPEHMP